MHGDVVPEIPESTVPLYQIPGGVALMLLLSADSSSGPRVAVRLALLGSSLDTLESKLPGAKHTVECRVWLIRAVDETRCITG